jgi:cysteine-rich repeat protein
LTVIASLFAFDVSQRSARGFARSRTLSLTVALVAIAGWLGSVRSADATVPTDLCTGNPCNVTGTVTIDPSSVLDFGTADLHFKGSAVVSVGPGAPGSFRSIVIKAHSITMEPGSKILGNGDNASVELDTAGGGDFVMQGSGSLLSRIDVSGNSAGLVNIVADGNANIGGTINASGSGAESVGGEIDADANGTMTITQPLSASAAGVDGTGGAMLITAGGDVNVNAILDVSAGASDGGSIEIDSDTGNITTTQKIDLDAGNPDGFGGELDETATLGSITVGGPVISTGGTGVGGDCGDGGDISFTSGTSITFNAPQTLNGGTACSGGSVTVTAGTTFVQQVGADISATGPGSFGSGGFFTLVSGTDSTLRNIDLSSAGFGGSLDGQSNGHTINVVGILDESGGGTQAIGGTLELRACTIAVAATGKIDTRGAFAAAGTGQTVLKASSTMTIAGTLLAETKNELRMLSGSPTITGTVTPAATIITDPTLPDCPHQAVCGDGHLDPGEACDDGNNVSCDGCKGDCSRADHVCGDGITECGEECDDGNTVDGDGCEHDCKLPGAAGLRIPGAIRVTAGCVAEWSLAISNGVINSTTGFPATTQKCIDGDPSCDTDLANDGKCVFGAQVCTRVPDPRLSSCFSSHVASINLRAPHSTTLGKPEDIANTQSLLTALEGLPLTVQLAGAVVRAGTPDTIKNDCSPRASLLVPHLAGKTGTKTFNIMATDINGLTMSANQIHLECLPNNAVCGNGIKEVGEQCDDGNTNACDGCSPTCHVEACGNGIVECNEQCDDGPNNGTAGDSCSATCTELPPPLRIPGGGTKSLDCGFEWSADLNATTLAVDKNNLPKNVQVCKDNDPECDLDPTVGTCTVRIWGCFGGADARLGCAAMPVGVREIQAPKATAKSAADIAARLAFNAALQTVATPAGPGEVCTSRFDVVVPGGNRGITLKLKSALNNKKTDTDTLKIKCLP